MHGVANLDVAVARFRPGGHHAQRQYLVVASHQFHAVDDTFLETVFPDNGLVAGNHHHARMLVAVADAIGGPRHAGSGVAVNGFAEHILTGQFGQLLYHIMGILMIGAYVDVLNGDNATDTVEGGLHQRPSR